MKGAEKLNITRSLELFEEAPDLFPAESWAPEDPAILSRENIRSLLISARAEE